jgi:hypothetical protein
MNRECWRKEIGETMARKPVRSAIEEEEEEENMYFSVRV